MQDSLSGRAAELAHLTDLIRTSLSLADAAIPLINEQLNGLAEMGIDNLEATDKQGRPFNLLAEGKPIEELFG
jgi:hypothetical protein